MILSDEMYDFNELNLLCEGSIKWQLVKFIIEKL